MNSIQNPSAGQAAEPTRPPRTDLVTLVFTDMVGSTALKQQVGDKASSRFFDQHHALVRQSLQSFARAQEIETAGDSFLITFGTPSDAVQFALLLQARLRTWAQESRIGMQDRIGIHLGEVLVKGDEAGARPTDLYGIPIDTCSRVMSLAQAGQVLMTRAVFDSARQVLKGEDIPGVGPLEWLNHGRYRLKGIDEPIEVCEARARAGNAGHVVAPPSSEKAQRVLEDGELVLGWRPAVGLTVPGTAWELLEKLGEGGFGEVWLGQHRHLNEQRVFKFCFQADRVRSLKREMKLFRLLKERVGEHPNIVRLHEVYFEQPPFYLEEEYVTGRDLRRWSQERGGIEQIPVESRVEIVAQAADGLQAAHDAGVIHRDVKPGNILIAACGLRNADLPNADCDLKSEIEDLKFPEAEGGLRNAETNRQSRVANRQSEEPCPQPAIRNPQLRVKLTDFGIGQVISEEALAGMTRAGFTQTMPLPGASLLTGTQLYIAPEVLAGKPASTRSDIYALGVVLYQLLVADFQRPVTTEWAADINDPLLEDDLRHCFSGRPSDRFAGAGLLAQRLRALPQRRAALKEEQNRIAARERAAYRRGMMRTAAIASAIVAVIAVLAWQVRSNALAKFRQAAQIRTRSVHLTLANGLNPAGSGDWLSAALWFAEAFVLDEAFQTPSEALLNGQTHRLRLNSVLRQSPQIEQMWFDEPFRPRGLDGAAVRVPPMGSADDAGYQTGGFDLTGERVLLGSVNGYQLYSTASGRAVGPRLGVGSARASLRPDGRRAVTGGGNTNALFTVWDTLSGTRLFDLQAPGNDQPLQSDCTDLQFSPNGHWIAAALPGGRAQTVVWEADTGRVRQTIAYADQQDLGWKDGDSILAARFDPTSERLLTTGTDNRAVIWQWQAGRKLQVLRGHRSWVYSGCFGHAHTNWVVTCSFDRTARLWDLTTQHVIHQVKHEDDSIQDVQFSPVDDAFATCGLDSTVRMWDSETGQLIPPIIRDHGRATQLHWSPAGRRLLTISWDGVARLWRLAPQKPILEPTPSDYSDDGAYALGVERGHLRVQNALDGRDVVPLPLPGADLSAWCFAGRDQVLSFSRSDLATAAELNGVQLWRRSSRKPVGEPLAYDPHWSHFLCARDGERFAFYNGSSVETGPASEQGLVVWEPSRTAKLRTITFPKEDVTAAAMAPDGRRVAVATRDRITRESVLRWVDLDSDQKPTVLWRSRQDVSQVSFSPDGQWLALAPSDPSLAPRDAFLWPLGGSAATPFAGPPARLAHQDGVLCISFSDSCRMVATGSEDQTAEVWHWTHNRWEASARSLRCGGQVYACCFSHNGRWLATAYRTPTSQQSSQWGSSLRIWDVASGEPISLPVSFPDKLTRLAFVADDTHLLLERWLLPALPQRWIIDLGIHQGSAQDFLLRAELLSAQRSFLSEEAEPVPDLRQGALSAEEALARATSVGPLRPLSKGDCQSLWQSLSKEAAAPR